MSEVGAHQPGGLDDFVDWVVPVLQERGEVAAGARTDASASTTGNLFELRRSKTVSPAR